MESFFSRYRNALVLIVVLVAQLLALAIQAKRPKADGADRPAVSFVRYTVVTLVTPPERVFHSTGLWFRSVWFGYIDLVHVRRENATLQQQVQRLRLEQDSIAQDAAQGLRLQHLLGFKEKYVSATLPAQVIGTSGTEQSQVLYIDKGSKDGLKQDMPVITADGIVGKVKDVFPHTSQVLLVTDPTSAAGVVLQKTRIRGILRGRAYGQLEVSDISPDSRVQAGETVVTSGGDQIFPRGLPVGTVERVVPDPDRDPLVDVLVRPAAKLSQLEEVLVITSTSDAMSAQEAKDLAASEAEGKAEQQRASDILAERLPSRIDPNAPADTNPPSLVDASGNTLKPPAPPLPNHPDRFSPGAEPDAAQMTPGGRWAPVKYGTEDRIAPPRPPKPASTNLTPKAAPRPNSASLPASGTAARPATISPELARQRAGSNKPTSQPPAESPSHAGSSGSPTAVRKASATTITPKKPRVIAPPAPAGIVAAPHTTPPSNPPRRPPNSSSGGPR